MSEDPGLRARLVQAALILLEKHGSVPSLRAVARATSVSAMTPYSYFSDKAALMGAVADRGFEVMARELQDADAHEDPVEALIAQGIAFVTFARSNRALFRLIYSHEYGHAQTDGVRRTYDILRNRVESVIPLHVSAGTLACRSLVQGMATIVLNSRLEPSSLEDVDAAIRLLVEGLAAIGSGSGRT